MKKTAPNALKRVIVDHKKVDQKILALLAEKYPYGYGDDDVITFKNAKSQVVEALEVRTKDCIYLVKVSIKLSDQMSKYGLDTDFDNNNSKESDAA